MTNDLIVFENQLKPLTSHFEDVLAGVMPVERLMRTAIVAVEKNIKLLDANRQSLFNTIMSSAVLGLEMDGVTGQAFPIPFGNKVQLVIGYKGYSTLGARGGLTITGDVVREGDVFDFEKGSSAFVRHRPRLGNAERIIAAWACAAALSRPPIIEVMPIGEIMVIKNRAPGGKKPDSPWNDPVIGFPAMATKTPKRRLARSTPLTVMHLAAAMEEAFEERGKLSHLAPDRILRIEGEAPIAARQTSDAPDAVTLLTPHDNEADQLFAEGLQRAQAGLLWVWWDELTKPQRLKVQARLPELRKIHEGNG